MTYPFTPGEILTATNLNAVTVPDSLTTWSSPINAGITVGDGATVASYCQFGELVFARFRFVLGSTSSITGAVTLNLPVTSDLGHFPSGDTVALFDSSATTVYPGHYHGTGATAISLRSINAAATSAVAAALSGTVPFTWATGDVIAVTLLYAAT